MIKSGIMWNRISFALLCIAIVVLLFNFLFGWMHANIDSYFYYAIGEYFRTGTYPFQPPFVYTKPTTISPPLYGLLFPLTDLGLHALQLTLLAATGYLLYKTLRLRIPKTHAVIISCLFTLYPTNIIYANNVMTENPSQFVVMLITYLLTSGHAAKSILVASIGTLLKYNLGIYVPFSFLFFLKKPKLALFPILGCALLIGWIGINHSITGVWGLYDTRGTQLYNQFVAQTRLLPPENHPAVIRMRSLLPPGADIAVPYWDIQQQLSQKLGNDWLAVDRVLYDVAVAAVKTYPVKYILHSIKNYALIHYDHVPHWRNIGNVGVSGLTGTDSPFCGTLGSVTTCAPIIATPWSYPLWNAYVRVEMTLFETLAKPAFFLLLLPSLIYLLIRGPRLYALLYLAGTVPIAFTIHPDPRYIVPFYPLSVLVIVSAIRRWYSKIYDPHH